MSDGDDEALPGLVRAVAQRSGAAARARRATQAAPQPPADVDPVARVLVDVPLAHLDRDFDYAVPASMALTAVPGARVKVRFAGRDVDGFVLERAAASEHDGRLTPLRRVVSPEPVLSPEIAALAADVAARWAGVRSDVLRLAVPPRHATTEKQATEKQGSGAPDRAGEPDRTAEPASVLAAARDAWAGYPAGEAFLGHLSVGGSPRAVWGAPPGADWPSLVAHAAAVTLAAGRGVLVCVPDRRDVDRVGAALTATLGPDRHVALLAEAGPAARYRDFLAVSRGHRRVVVGSRSAAFAPVHDLGLVVCWDDGDDLLDEPRAPYPHARDVLLMRAERAGAAALLGGFARSVEADRLVRTGWARELVVPRTALRDAVTVSVAGATDVQRERDPSGGGARIPREVHDLVRSGLETGPVLVQTPRAGYALRLACDRCREPAVCVACAGPLALGGPTVPPTCRWCGTAEPAYTCGVCGGHGLRAPVVGESRTADEIGRAFPRSPVLRSSRDRVLAEVDDRPAVVVATPGAEPVARGGYAAVVLLDTWLLLGREGLRVGEEALRRWSNAVGLVRPGGRAVAVGDPAHPTLQALVRWDHPGFVAHEAHERASAHLPPASRVAVVSGAPGAVDDALTLLQAPPGLEVLGPVPVDAGHTGHDGHDGDDRVVLRVPRAHGPSLARALGEVQRVRSVRKLDAVRVHLDPLEV